MDEVFEVTDRQWRGIGPIPASGYKLRAEYAAYDAERVFGAGEIHVEEPADCIAALVMQGLKKPVDCPAFGTGCTPERPMGASMVSSEGACAAYWAYRRHGAEAEA
jgi:hydrogenase expression/formation protein HypD